MKESTVKNIEKSIKFESGEEIKISVTLKDVKKSIYAKNFLETMFKEIQRLFID